MCLHVLGEIFDFKFIAIAFNIACVQVRKWQKLANKTESKPPGCTCSNSWCEKNNKTNKNKKQTIFTHAHSTKIKIALFNSYHIKSISLGSVAGTRTFLYT